MPPIQIQPGGDPTLTTAAAPQVTLAQFSAHAGPLPSPETLAEYDRAIPGSAERIIAMAERQAAHRQEMERRYLEAPVKDAQAGRIEARIGQIFALIIGVTGLTASVVIILAVPNGAGAATASIVGGSTVLGLVASFIIGQRVVAKERHDEPEGPEKPAS